MSKKWNACLFLFGLLAAVSAALAADAEGFRQKDPENPTTAAIAGTLPDGSRVVLRGRIVNRIRTHYYTFQDETGTIPVDIENRIWRGRTVTPDDGVEIVGRIYIGFRGLRVEVERLRKMNEPPSAEDMDENGLKEATV